jgi:hypothetical protein
MIESREQTRCLKEKSKIFDGASKYFVGDFVPGRMFQSGRLSATKSDKMSELLGEIL